VAVALEIVRAVGVDGLTMRALADRLGVSVAAAYKHVADKEALIGLAADELLSRVEAGDVVGSDWTARVRELMVGFYDVMSAHPGMGAYLARSAQENPRRHITATMREILEPAGFVDPEVLTVMGILVFYASGALQGAISRDVPPSEHAAMLREVYCRGLDALIDGFRVSPMRRASARTDQATRTD
jgi:AcrR family transcriptional regulator